MLKLTSKRTGAIFGFAILKAVSVSMPTWLGGGYFGEKENVTVQTAATGEHSFVYSFRFFADSFPLFFSTASGGLGILFVRLALS